MLIIGSQGFATQLTDVIRQIDKQKHLLYYDDTLSVVEANAIKDKKIVTTISEAQSMSSQHGSFALGVGEPKIRKRFYNLFKELNFLSETIISPFCRIGFENIEIGEGTTILTNSIIESNSKIGKGCLINLGCLITHHSTIGNFCELGPGVILSGRSKVGNETFIGAGAIILPKVNIGDNVIVGAGCVVLHDVPDNSTIVGVPGKIIK